jgi:protocatechuate 3,4-dioxygenase beta subunit
MYDTEYVRYQGNKRNCPDFTVSFNMRLQYFSVLLLSVCVCLSLSFIEGQQCSATGQTPTDMLGPFYLANSPKTGQLAPDDELSNPALRLEVYGRVLSNSTGTCVGLSNVVVEVWYAGMPDAYGNYYQPDEYRGQLVTNECGEYSFTQAFPALYPERPILHVHFRLSRDGQEFLVTQMYFEGEATGYVTAGSRELQAVQVMRDDNGARTVEFNIYINAGGGEQNNCTQSSSPAVLEGGSTTAIPVLEPAEVQTSGPHLSETTTPKPVSEPAEVQPSEPLLSVSTTEQPVLEPVEMQPLGPQLSETTTSLKGADTSSIQKSLSASCLAFGILPWLLL